MKRFHVHLAVNDLGASIQFYSKLFGQSPSKHRQDYAKWTLEDPRLNFAISSRGHAAGLNHFGMQADSLEELEALKVLADDASKGATLDQGERACCYARSEKHWTLDPQGVAWEHFFTLSDATTYGEDSDLPAAVCCVPVHSADAAESEASLSCCVSKESTSAQANCCE